jgi:hypothetical protein
MIKIKTLEIAGFASAVQALRLPFKKECRSLTTITQKFNDDKGIDEPYYEGMSIVDFEPKDLHLMSVLVKRGTEHAKVTRGLIVYAEIEAPVYWWCELETYRAGHERLSSESTMHVDCKGLSGEELVKAKSEIPMGKMLKKVDFFSYQCLRNIVKQRKGHRLPEWGVFIDWVRTLPFAEQLIFVGLEDE